MGKEKMDMYYVLLNREIGLDRRTGEDVLLIGHINNPNKEYPVMITMKEEIELADELLKKAQSLNNNLEDWSIDHLYRNDDKLYVFASVSGNG